MAPEQVAGRLWMAGATIRARAVLVTKCCRRRAFARDTSADTMMAILQEDPPEFSRTRVEIPPALDRIVRHCLEKNVANGSSRRAMWPLRSKALSGSTTGSGATAIVPPTRERRVLRWAIVAALIVAAATAGGFAGRVLAPRGTTPVRFTIKTFDAQSIANARFMPDGQAIVFQLGPDRQRGAIVRDSREHARSARVRASTDSPAVCVIQGGAGGLTDVPFRRPTAIHGTLARMSLEAVAPWMEHVREADWSPDGSTLAIVHDLGTKDRLEYSDRQPSSTRQPAT